jgi:cytoskeletal protein RodZ
MSIDIQKFTMTDVISIPFGMRLKSAREARGLESKDVAAQLRLSEKMISMIEKETYPSDLPITFIRGYIRAYARLMEISDSEITKALEPLKQPTILPDEEHELIEPQPVTSGNYFMQFFTYLILLTILSLVGVWWYSQSSSDDRSAMTTEMPITQNATDNNVVSPNAPPRDTTINANPMPMSTPGEVNETNLQQPAPQIVTELTAGTYALHLLVHFILFLLIALFLLWREARSINKPTQLLTALMVFSLISLGPLWWYYYSQFVSPAYALKTTNEISSPVLAPTGPLEKGPTIEVSPAIGSTPSLEEKPQSNPPIPTTIINDDKTTHEKPKQDLSQTTKNDQQNTDETVKASTTPTPTSSGLYTPVPSSTKKHSNKYRKNSHVMALPVEQTRVARATAQNEFADLDKDDNY